MVQELLKSAGISGYLTKNGITPATWVTGSASPERSSVDVQRVSLREALNEIAMGGRLSIKANTARIIYGFRYGDAKARPNQTAPGCVELL
jgi:hypothetical protein